MIMNPVDPPNPAIGAKSAVAKAPPTAADAGRTARLLAALWSRKWLVMTLVVVVAIAGWQGERLFFGPTVAVALVSRGSLIETVVATGSVETPFRAEIASQITGTVEEVLVDEGQRVTKGQPLIAIESRELRADVAQAQAAVAQAAAHMRQLSELTLPTARQSQKEAQATTLNAQQTLNRAADLARDGFETRVALDAAQKDVDVARTAVRTAELQGVSASPGGSDYVTGETQLNQARANLDTAIARLGYATISAPRAGVLITRNVEQGAVVQPGVTLLVLAPDGETQLLLAIDERNLGKLAMGQKAVASADAYPTQKFSAVVGYINPAVDITRASVEVKLTVADPPRYLRQDMTVSVDIDVAHSDTALLLPGGAVHDALSSAPWVMALKQGKAVKTPVRLGLQGNTKVELLDGVAEGDQVVPVSAAVVDGQRIRAASP